MHLNTSLNTDIIYILQTHTVVREEYPRSIELRRGEYPRSIELRREEYPRSIELRRGEYPRS